MIIDKHRVLYTNRNYKIKQENGFGGYLRHPKTRRLQSEIEI